MADDIIVKLISSPESEVRRLLSLTVDAARLLGRSSLQIDSLLDGIADGVGKVRCSQDNRDTSKNVEMALRIIQEFRLREIK